MRLVPLVPLVLLLSLLLSCSDDDDGVLLRVDVVTDYVPGLEFEVVEVEVEGADFRFRRPVASVDEYLRGQRVGELMTAGEESLTLVGRLLDPSGIPIAERRVSVALRERTTQTLVFTRSCADVMCPSGDPLATECQGGACVTPDCSPENPEACGTESGCSADGDCQAPDADCAEARCLEGICLEAEIVGRCGADEVCQPTEGCVTRPSRRDMGLSPFDGGASIDGGTTLDFGMAECDVDGDCDDGAFCNGGERCIEGMCEAAERPVMCDDGVACTVDSCDETMDRCTAGGDDGLCTAEDDGTCDIALGCQYPVCTPATCTAGPCQTASCEGDVCVRTNLCGGSEICCGGSCVPAGCDDGNPCTDDSCGGGGCVHTNNTDPCSDGDACTVGDRCAGGSCGGGSARNCNDLNPCTNDSCDPSSGCRNMNVSAGTPCGSDCGSWSACGGPGSTCQTNGGSQSRTCIPRECNGSGACVNGEPETDFRSCTLLEGSPCNVCDDCSELSTICVGYCDDGCCVEGIIP